MSTYTSRTLNELFAALPPEGRHAFVLSMLLAWVVLVVLCIGIYAAHRIVARILVRGFAAKLSVEEAPLLRRQLLSLQIALWLAVLMCLIASADVGFKNQAASIIFTLPAFGCLWGALLARACRDHAMSVADEKNSPHEAWRL